MPFHAPSILPPVPAVPDNISLETFIFNEKYGRNPISHSQAPFICGLTGTSYSVAEVRTRVDHLARVLCRELNVKPNEGSEWDKVVAAFSLNTIDYLTLAWAVHRIGGILTCANAAYTAQELAYQIKDSGAKAIFTCLPLLETCKEGVVKTKISDRKIFLFSLPSQVEGFAKASGIKTIDDLISEGSELNQIRPADASWQPGASKEKCAFLCYSSGTSGLPKGVMISHYNIIANVLQANAHESQFMDDMRKKTNNVYFTERSLGLLPLSHIYALVCVGHSGPYRGNCAVILPKYDFKWLLQSIQEHKINTLFMVPPMLIHLVNQRKVVEKFDLTSVRNVYCGAAPLGKELAEDLLKIFPSWSILQAYGLTETATVVCMTRVGDVCFGTSGNLVPGVQIRLVTADGEEVTEYDTPGELWVKSPSVTLGYHNNAKATAETYTNESDGRYMRTGDEAIITKSPAGYEHVAIVDRIKELIKVKGHQVAPAELEAHLLAHPDVDDCVVIGVPSDREGEVPKAFVVRAQGGAIEEGDAVLRRRLLKHVEQGKTNYKWLRGGLDFIEAVPKSPSGKILRRLIRDQEKEKMRRQGAKL